MKIYAVYDINVLISSLLTQHRDSATSQVVDAIASKKIIPLYNQNIFYEYNEVLHRKKFNFPEEKIQKLLSVIRSFGRIVNASPVSEILPDMDDVIFYEVVMEKRDDNAYLITGNMKHFPKRNYIVMPSQMMEILNQS